MSEAPRSTEHQSRGRALILMSQTQHPCCSCSLTPFYTHTDTHTYTYTAFRINVPHSLSLICSPLLSFTHFFFPSLPPLSSLLSCSPVSLTTTTVMIHVMNHRQIFLKVSAHIYRSLPPFFSFCLSVLLPLYTLCLAFLSPLKVPVCSRQDLSLPHISEEEGAKL